MRPDPPQVTTNPLTIPGPPLVIGHRGNRAFAPENTLESFRQAVGLGVDGLEFDVRVTRDGEVVVFHDETVERTTDGRGRIADMTWDEVRRLDAGAGFVAPDGSRPYLGKGIGVPRLADVLSALPDLPVIVEVKVAEAAIPTRAVILSGGWEQRCVAGAFRAEILRPFSGSSIPRTATIPEIRNCCVPALLGWRPSALPFQVMSLPRVFKRIPLPLARLAAMGRAAGVPLHAWTINAVDVAHHLWDHGIRGVLTDDPARLLAVRRARRDASAD